MSAETLKPWVSSGDRIEDEWYWVTDGRAVWPAMAYKRAVGGWSNVDTWEDFNHDVIAWQHIERPAVPRPKNASAESPK